MLRAKHTVSVLAPYKLVKILSVCLSGC